jgi:tetratricopeptide (TPR) repeat protein
MRWKALLALGKAIPLTITIVSGVATAQDRDQMVQSLLTDARMAQSRGDFSQAAEAYRKAVALDPAIPELWANLGLMDHESGNHLEAVKSFEHAAHLNPLLFVPQLFLGLEYLESDNAGAALPLIENAVRLNPGDLQAALSLGRAYEMLDQPGRAAGSYFRATQIAPTNGDAWLQLGTAYLEQVENDARIMTSAWNNSGYVKLRAAETFADEDKLGSAEEAFKAALNTPSPAPCVHAELGIVLLRESKEAEARKQFETENQAASHCGLSPLGIAVTDIAQRHPDMALKELTVVVNADPDFVRSSLPLFRGAVSPDQAQPFIALAQSSKSGRDLSFDIGSVVHRVLVSGDLSINANSDYEHLTQKATGTHESAEQLYASARFAQCDEALKPALDRLPPSQLRLLASCSFSTGDFKTASIAGERLKSSLATAVQGLYWESKADQKLAVAALTHAGEIDPDSPGLHLLIGNAFRQQRRWSDAEAEYEKAVTLDPTSRAARLGLGIVLFTELKTDEAFAIDKSLLDEMPEDPEANLLAAEILVQEHKFQAAEPFLLKCHNVKPELLPRVHVLLGRVYGETNRPSDAIAEYKLGITMDEDGSLHYQLARLYQKTGNENAAAEEMQLSKQLREQWDDRAHLDLGQPLTETNRQ